MKSAIRNPKSAIRKAFTLVELLVIIGIILLLAGILVPAFDVIRQNMKAKLTQANIVLIATACDMYANDYDDEYPPSNDVGWPRYFDDANDRYGKKIIVLLLTGYASDGTSTTTGEPYATGSNTMSEDDGRDGFGFRTTARGKVHGPYNGTEKLTTSYIDENGNGTKDATEYPFFVDAFGNAILYYKADDTGDFIKTHNPESDTSGVIPYIQEEDEGDTDHPGQYDNRGIPYLITSPGKNGTYDEYGSDNDDVKNVQNPEPEE